MYEKLIPPIVKGLISTDRYFEFSSGAACVNIASPSLD